MGEMRTALMAANRHRVSLTKRELSHGERAMRRFLKILVVVFSLIGVTSSTRAEMVSLQQGVSPWGGYEADAVFVRSNQADTKQDAARPDELLVGGQFFNTLLEFDLSVINTQAGGQPVTIDSVQLVMNTHHSGSGGNNNMTVDVCQYDFNLIEENSTWNDPDGDGSPTTGDLAGGGTFGTFLTSETFNQKTLNMDVVFPDTTAFHTAVSDALGSTDHTLRLILKDNVIPHGGYWAYFCSNEYGSTTIEKGWRPELIVSFTVIPEPGSAALLLCGGLTMICLARRRMRRGTPSYAL